MTERKLLCRCGCKNKFSPKNMHEVFPKFFVHKTHIDEYLQSEDYKKQELLHEMYNLGNCKFDYVVLKKQIEKFLDEGYKLEGIKLTLKYYLEVDWWKPEYGMGQFMPSYYKRAKANYLKMKKVKQNINNLNTQTKINDYRGKAGNIIEKRVLIDEEF